MFRLSVFQRFLQLLLPSRTCSSSSAHFVRIGQSAHQVIQDGRAEEGEIYDRVKRSDYTAIKRSVAGGCLQIRRLVIRMP